ncbi:MAG TPA: YeeE/YedE thiosulfate transporter family protein [Myxococcota bacterium]|nr:YeeE/YedE thiosulfate transporter family protein [Myxococcota bacterium]
MTPLAGATGGALIGLATAGLLLVLGRIAGISGILGGAFAAERGDLAWRLTFLAGLPLGAWLATLATGDLHGFALTAQPALLVTGGLLVGFGTQLGSGCTSGHGVCGLARGSPRSLAATAIFMATGAVTVFVVRHVLGGT